MESFYGGKEGSSFAIVKSYKTIQEMVNDFKQGNNYKDVKYNEYVLINTVNKNDKDNGKLFRRGYNITDSMGGAKYIGTIVGPQGVKGDTVGRLLIGTNEDNKKVFQYTIIKYDEVEEGEEGSPIDICGYNIINNIEVKDDGTLIVHYTYEDDDIFEKKIKWVQSLEVDQLSHHLITNFNTGETWDGGELGTEVFVSKEVPITISDKPVWFRIEEVDTDEIDIASDTYLKSFQMPSEAQTFTIEKEKESR